MILTPSQKQALAILCIRRRMRKKIEARSIWEHPLLQRREQSVEHPRTTSNEPEVPTGSTTTKEYPKQAVKGTNDSRSRLVNESTDSSDDCAPPARVRKRRRGVRKRRRVAKTFGKMSETSSDEEEPDFDKLFLLSLHDSLKALPEPQKSRFKMDAVKLMLDHHAAD